MGTRDKYSTALVCSKCGTKGTAWWSEWDRPTIYSGAGLRLEALSEEFIGYPHSVIEISLSAVVEL